MVVRREAYVHPGTETFPSASAAASADVGTTVIGWVMVEQASWSLLSALVEDARHVEMHYTHIQCCIWCIGDSWVVLDRSESLMFDKYHKTDELWAPLEFGCFVGWT